MAEPTFSIYRQRDRELLFHGNLAACKAAGIKVRMSERRVLWRGDWRVILNHCPYNDGSFAVWIP